MQETRQGRPSSAVNASSYPKDGTASGVTVSVPVTGCAVARPSAFKVPVTATDPSRRRPASASGATTIWRVKGWSASVRRSTPEVVSEKGLIRGG